MYSKKHHYIPQYFIKGFIAPESKLWVYDKLSDSIKAKSPKSIFYEWNRNSITINGVETDFAEKSIYRFIDEFLSDIIKKIQNGTIQKEEYEFDVIESIRTMAFFTFYRAPASNSLINECINKNGNEYKIFLRNRIKGGNKIDENIINQLLKHLIPFIHSADDKNKITENIINYSIYDLPSSALLLSDFPIIFENNLDFNSFNDSMIFPITANKLYFGLRSNNTWLFNYDILIRINLLLAIQAQRYFGSSNKKLLENYVKAYKTIAHVQEYGFTNIKPELFNKINNI